MAARVHNPLWLFYPWHFRCLYLASDMCLGQYSNRRLHSKRLKQLRAPHSASPLKFFYASAPSDPTSHPRPPQVPRERNDEPDGVALPPVSVHAGGLVQNRHRRRGASTQKSEPPTRATARR